MSEPPPTPARPSPLPPAWWNRVRHDLRSALGPIRLAVQLLRGGRVEPADQDEALQVIDRQVEQLLAGIEDIGELLRIHDGRFRLDDEPRDANLLLDVVCGRGALLRALADRQLTLRCDPCHAEALVQHDPARVAALLEFLLVRAAAHAAPGSELVLGLRQDGGVSLHLAGAAATLGADAELAHLLSGGTGRDEPSLRALLMREVLRAGAMELRSPGDGTLSLHFAE